MDLLVLALQTDTTRVGTFMLAHGFSRCNFGFMGLKGITIRSLTIRIKMIG